MDHLDRIEELLGELREDTTVTRMDMAVVKSKLEMVPVLSLRLTQLAVELMDHKQSDAVAHAELDALPGIEVNIRDLQDTQSRWKGVLWTIGAITALLTLTISVLAFFWGH